MVEAVGREKATEQKKNLAWLDSGCGASLLQKKTGTVIITVLGFSTTNWLLKA
jgi:hypothetical protein